jgi:flagellar basal-body rod protein FlgG
VLSQGTILQTGNPLDVAIRGNGYFQINLPTGTIAYTRDGNFTVDNQGQITNMAGYVVAPGITIPEGAESVAISEFGQITAKVTGTTQQLGQIQLVNFINPAGLEAVGGNLFLESVASGAPTQGNPGANGLGELKQGFVEQSNVSVAEELINMIQAQRGYDVNTRVVRASDEVLQRLAQV